MIRLSHVDVDRGAVPALIDVSLHIATGTSVAVIGPNGSGKSTLFALLSGRLSPSRGSVTVDGAVADVLQATAIDPQLRLTVEDVVGMGRYATCGYLRPFRSGDRRAVHDAMERVGLGPLRRQTVDTLSGGQRQRALLAQGLVQDAPVLLLDEPTTGLDMPSQRRIHEVIDEERRAGRTVLCATHALDDAARADVVVALARRCLCCAPPAQALSEPAVIELFAPQALRAPAAFAPLAGRPA